MNYRLVIFWVAWLVLCVPAAADQVTVKNGSVIIGDILHMTEGKLKMKTEFAGEIEIPWEQVSAVETDETLPVVLGEQGSLNAVLESPEPGKAEIIAASEDVTGIVDLSRVTAINPPPPPPIRWTGSIVGAYSKSTGNTENTVAALKADTRRRTAKDRITVGFLWNYKEDEDGLTERNVMFETKYDYFFNEKLFGYGNLRLENDKFKDLRVRTGAGAGLGYQFVETKRVDFSVEGGLSYVNEDFYDAEDDDFVAGRLASNLDAWIIEEWLRFLQSTAWLVNLEDTGDWLLYTDTSLRLKITKDWSANAGLIYNYESEPPPDTEKEDTTYLLGLAYEF
jgi:putative salt-induced outer membrane protein YdiY